MFSRFEGLGGLLGCIRLSSLCEATKVHMSVMMSDLFFVCSLTAVGYLNSASCVFSLVFNPFEKVNFGVSCLQLDCSSVGHWDLVGRPS